jgi:hypothetical protein
MNYAPWLPSGAGFKSAESGIGFLIIGTTTRYPFGMEIEGVAFLSAEFFIRPWEWLPYLR